MPASVALIPEPCAEDIGVMPGVRISNCVKFRPLRGSSLSGVSLITVPSSEVEDCNKGASALTVIDSLTDPTSNRMFCVSV